MNSKTKKIVGIGLFTAIVLVLQFLGGGIKFGMFSISLVLVPIVVGAAVYGWQAGAWLGFAFGVAVLISGDAAAFFSVNAVGTVLTVLVKGTAAGLCSGLIYKLMLIPLSKNSQKRIAYLKKHYGLGECCEDGVYNYFCWNNRYVAVIVSAVICPVINTGIFLLGCKLFFMETIAGWGAAAGFANAASYMFFGLAGTNFLIELATNLFLSPVIVRLISLTEK